MFSLLLSLNSFLLLHFRSRHLPRKPLQVWRACSEIKDTIGNNKKENLESSKAGNHFMQSSSCIQDLAAFQVAIPSNTTLRGLLRRNICQQVLCHSKREWFFGPVMMEGDTGNSLSNEKQPLEGSTSDNEVEKPTESNASTSVFVNRAAIAWQQNRSEWIGDQSQRSKRMPKDPIISWSTTYEDLLSTNEPFPEPIPLPEMVDFLVDIWHDEGLYD